MTEKEAKKFIENSKWVFAKSYADTFPHEYTTRDKAEDIGIFEDFIRYMRDNSKIKSFFGKAYLYCEIDGLEYWEMGRPIKTIVVINRAKIDDDRGYRANQHTEEDKEILLKALKDREERYEELSNKRNLNEREKKELYEYNLYKYNKIDELSKIKTKSYGKTYRKQP